MPRSSELNPAHDQLNYHYEKILGKRTETGALKLKELKPVHKQLISLHLQGYKNIEVANILELTEAWVSTVLSDPLAVELIELFNRANAQKINQLRRMALDVTHEGLGSSSMKDKLRAADQVYKLTGEYGKDDEGGAGAEDLIVKILESLKDHNQTIRTLARGRPALLVEGPTEDTEIIDG